MQVDKLPDKLRNRDGRVSVVELNGVHFRKFGEILPMYRRIFPQQVGQRGAAEKVLLLQPQSLARIGVIVGVEHPGNVLRTVFLLYAPGVFLLVEERKIKGL